MNRRYLEAFGQLMSVVVRRWGTPETYFSMEMVRAIYNIFFLRYCPRIQVPS